MAPPSKDYDPNNPFGIFQMVHQGVPAIIPCRPTSPSITVRLIKGPVISSGVALSLSEDFTFNPEEGFKVHYPNDFYNGIFHCVASDGDQSDNIMAIFSYKGKSRFCTELIECI